MAVKIYKLGNVGVLYADTKPIIILPSGEERYEGYMRGCFNLRPQKIYKIIVDFKNFKYCLCFNNMEEFNNTIQRMVKTYESKTMTSVRFK